MLPVDRQQRDAVDKLVEDFTHKGLSRREFMKRGLALGLSATAAGAILDACGGSSSGGSVKTLDVLSVWGDTELASFKATVAPFQQQSGITVNVESTRDLDTVLTARIRGGNAPDIAILPNPGKMQQLAGQNHLKPLDSWLDMGQIQQNYAKAWIDLGSYNSKLYAIFYKAANKATVWYSPSQFQASSYQVPATWSDLIALSDRIAAGA